ncbi:MAG: Tol-Pal system beta propeller repeat protein TolB [Rubrivivax sp.]
MPVFQPPISVTLDARLNLPPWPRRRFIGALAAACTTPAAAQFRVEIAGIGGNQIPIMVADFRDQGKSPAAVADIVRADLTRSGLFRIVDVSGSLDERSRIALDEWRGRGADALAVGSVAQLADGRFDVRFKLWDLLRGEELIGQSNAAQPADMRLAAHRIADVIYTQLTGDKGVFSTRIAFVTRVGQRHTLHVTDADGEGGQIALASPDPIISPAWSPNGKELAYVSFESQKAVVWVQDVSTGQRRSLADFRGSNSAPAWSPDGSSVALALARDGSTQLYIMPRAGGTPRRLTNSPSIDTEPVFSPDGRDIYFVSDRGGGPQIYRTPATGGPVERITFTGAYNISPAISLDGKMLAYIARQGSAHRLTLMELPSGTPMALSDTSDDTSPSFAPNGRLLVYASRIQGRGALMTTTLDGKIKSRLLSTGADMREPAWGPFGR